MNRIKGIGLSLLAVGVIACGEPGDPESTVGPALASSTSATLVECPTDVAYSTTGTVLPLGGSVSFRGHSVTAPSGAVVLPTDISIAEPASQYMLVDFRANGQEHFQFHAPLTVTISYARCSRANIDKAPLSVWHVDPATGELLQNMGGVDDKQARTITFQTDHFSGYAIAN